MKACGVMGKDTNSTGASQPQCHRIRETHAQNVGTIGRWGSEISGATLWGCGPVGQFAIRSAYDLGAERDIAIDRLSEHLRVAADYDRAEILNYEDVDVTDALKNMTSGRGPDACIDAVGMEAHGTTKVVLKP